MLCRLTLGHYALSTEKKQPRRSAPGQPDLVLSAGKTLAGKRGQGRGVAEVGQALDEEMFLLILVAALEVIGAEILIRLASF